MSDHRTAILRVVSSTDPTGYEKTINKIKFVDENLTQDTVKYPTVWAVRNYVDERSLKVVRNVGNSSINTDDQLKIDKGLSVATDGTVSTIDDALIPYAGAIASNVITMTVPTGYNANGIFSVKVGSGTNTAGTITAKVAGANKVFTVQAYKGSATISSFPAGAINANVPMLFVLKGDYFIWLNYDDVNLPTETTLPAVLVVGKHYKISAPAAITLKLPDTANDGDKIEVEYYNAGTASFVAAWCTETSTVSNLPILSNNVGTGGNTTCAAGALHKATCIYSGLANKWTVDLETMGEKSK